MPSSRSTSPDANVLSRDKNNITPIEPFPSVEGIACVSVCLQGTKKQNDLPQQKGPTPWSAINQPIEERSKCIGHPISTPFGPSLCLCARARAGRKPLSVSLFCGLRQGPRHQQTVMFAPWVVTVGKPSQRRGSSSILLFAGVLGMAWEFPTKVGERNTLKTTTRQEQQQTAILVQSMTDPRHLCQSRVGEQSLCTCNIEIDYEQTSASCLTRGRRCMSITKHR